jgi:hypothetical protein
MCNIVQVLSAEAYVQLQGNNVITALRTACLQYTGHLLFHRLNKQRKTIAFVYWISVVP